MDKRASTSDEEREANFHTTSIPLTPVADEGEAGRNANGFQTLSIPLIPVAARGRERNIKSPSTTSISQMSQQTPSCSGFKPQGTIHPKALMEFDQILDDFTPALRRAFENCMVHDVTRFQLSTGQRLSHMEQDLQQHYNNTMADAVVEALHAQRLCMLEVGNIRGIHPQERFLTHQNALVLALARLEAIKEGAREAYREDALTKRFALASGALTALLWVTSPDPTLHVKDTLNALPTYGNQVQSVGQSHEEFVNVFTELLRTLMDYVQRWYPHSCSAEGKRGENFALSVDEFDKLMKERLLGLLDVMERLGGGLDILSRHLHQAFNAQRRLVMLASMHRRPRGGKDTVDTTSLMLRETEEVLKVINQVAVDQAGQPFEDHINMVANAITSMSWPAVDDPRLFVSSSINALPTYANKVLSKRYLLRERGLHLQLTENLLHLLRGLLDYVTSFHKSGLCWNPEGAEIMVAYDSGDRSTWCLSSSLWDEQEE